MFYLSATCMAVGLQKACAHELHIFGTRDHTAASAKLGMLILMFIINVSQKTTIRPISRLFIYLLAVFLWLKYNVEYVGVQRRVMQEAFHQLYLPNS